MTFDEPEMFLQKIENNDETLKQVEKEEKSLVNERVEEPKSIARNRPRRKVRKPARFDDTIAYDFPLIDFQKKYIWRNRLVFRVVGQQYLVYRLKKSLYGLKQSPRQ